MAKQMEKLSTISLQQEDGNYIDYTLEDSTADGKIQDVINGVTPVKKVADNATKGENEIATIERTLKEPTLINKAIDVSTIIDFGYYIIYFAQKNNITGLPQTERAETTGILEVGGYARNEYYYQKYTELISLDSATAVQYRSNAVYIRTKNSGAGKRWSEWVKVITDGDKVVAQKKIADEITDLNDIRQSGMYALTPNKEYANIFPSNSKFSRSLYVIALDLFTVIQFGVSMWGTDIGGYAAAKSIFIRRSYWSGADNTPRWYDWSSIATANGIVQNAKNLIYRATIDNNEGNLDYVGINQTGNRKTGRLSNKNINDFIEGGLWGDVSPTGTPNMTGVHPDFNTNTYYYGLKVVTTVTTERKTFLQTMWGAKGGSSIYVRYGYADVGKNPTFQDWVKIENKTSVTQLSTYNKGIVEEA